MFRPFLFTKGYDLKINKVIKNKEYSIDRKSHQSNKTEKHFSPFEDRTELTALNEPFNKYVFLNCHFQKCLPLQDNDSIDSIYLPYIYIIY